MSYKELIFKALAALCLACGSNGVVIIDGRLSLTNMNTIAANDCKKRGFIAWQLFRGESFTRSSAFGQFVGVQS